jgi:MFS family permease
VDCNARLVRESLRAFARVFANRRLRRLQLAWAGSSVGGWAYVVALSVYAFREDGAFAVGALAFVRWLLAAAVAPFAGLLGDRYPRVRVMVLSDLGFAALLAAMAGLVAAGGPPLAVYALAVAASLAARPFRPAQAALLPSLARSPEELAASNVTASSIEAAGVFVGPALGGIVLAVANVEAAFLVTAALSLWSAAFVASVGEEARPAEPAEAGGLVSEAAAGFRTILAEPRLRLLVGLFAAQTFVDGALGVLVVVFALDTLDLGPEGVGFLNSAAGIGGIAGAVLAAALVGRRRLAGDFGLGIVLWGLPLVVIGLWPEPAVALVALALVGAGNTIVDVAGDTLLQRAVPDDVLARAFAALDSLLLVTVGLGAIAAPVLIDVLGAREAAVIVGALLPILAALSWRSLAAIDRDAEPPPELELLRSLPLFAPLPPATLEYLARRVVRRRVHAGERIVRRGEPGEAFYVIAEGQVEVVFEGRKRALGPGEFFGEIALLRDVPRTASVIAKTDAELFELPRDEFVAAVTGHAEATAAADAIVGARLGTYRPATGAV